MPEKKLSSDYLESDFTVQKEEAGMRADAYLALKAPFLSRTRLKQKIQQGQSLINGKKYSASKKVREGDMIRVIWREKDDRTPAPEPDILYEDNWILAVYKPAGLPVHPTGRKQSGTLIQGVHERYKAEIEKSLKEDDKEFYPRLINRLDLFTSGVVLIGKHKEPLLVFHEMIAERKIHKQYSALLIGELEKENGLIDFPLGIDDESEIRLKQKVREDGLPSQTRYEVAERLHGHTLVKTSPLTGRQHQIRVHFAYLGFPVWGDLVYIDESLFLRYIKNNCELDETMPHRHCLHAESVTFHHPFLDQEITINCEIPEDMEKIVSLYR